MYKFISPLFVYFFFLFVNHFFGFIVSFFYLNTSFLNYAIQLFLILVVSSIFVVLGWLSVNNLSKKNTSIYKYKSYILFFSILYIISAIYIFSKTPPALFFIMADDASLHELRASATKGKEGLDSIINGIYFFSSYLALPSAVLYSFHFKSRLRYIVLFISIFSLLLTLEKARTFIIFIPLAFYILHNNNVKKMLVTFASFLVIIVSISNFVGLDSDSLLVRDYSSSFVNRAAESSEKMIFEQPNTTQYLLNRIFWIPHITSIDWLRYHYLELNSTYLYGSTIPILYKIFGFNDRTRIENEVFKFQFNSGEGSLGSANTHFAVDAFLNFGILGVVFYSFLVGVLIKILFSYLPYPINLVAFNYSYSFVSASLHSQLLGGGILIFLVLIILLKFKISFKNDS